MSDVLHMTWDEAPYLVIDTETTGLSYEDRIIEVAFVVARAGKVLESFTTRVNPGRPISPESSAIHGITDDDVRDCPRFAEVLDSVRGYLCRDIPWVAHNLPFDARMLSRDVPVEVWPHGIPTFCSLGYARRYCRGLRRRQLADVAGYVGVSFDYSKAHGALYDSEVLAAVVPRLLAGRTVEDTMTKWSEAWIQAKEEE